MDSEKLIELVRIHVELFDLAHPKYIDVSHKERLWQEIGQKLNQTAANCKSRWNNIRDNYRKHLRKIVNKYGHDTTNIKKYKFSQQLEFLKKYMQMNETATTVIYKELPQIKEESFEDIGEPQVKESTSTENNYLTEPNDSGREEEEANEEINQNTAKNQTSRKRPSSSVLPTSKRKFQQKSTETASSTLMKYLLEKRDREETYPQQPDAIDAFLASIAPTLKKLSPYYQNIAKTKIFSIVQEFELRMIEEADKQPTIIRSPSSSLSSSSPNSHPPTPAVNSSSEILSSSISTQGSFMPMSYVPTTYTTLENSTGQELQQFDVTDPFEEKPQIEQL